MIGISLDPAAPLTIMRAGSMLAAWTYTVITLHGWESRSHPV